MKNKQSIREIILSLPIGQILDEMKDALDLANRSGDIPATIAYANRINVLNEIIDVGIEIEKETGIYSEGIMKCQK